MNDDQDRRARLLAETFHEDWATGAAAGFARAAAASARRRRRMRSALTVSGIAAAAAITGLIANRPPATFTPTPSVVAKAPPRPITAAIAPAAPAYEIISDEELMDRIPDLPLLIENDGHGGKRYTVLDPAPAGE